MFNYISNPEEIYKRSFSEIRQLAEFGEMSEKKSFQDSIKPAFGSFVGVIAGSVIKFLISLSFLFFYFDIFWAYREIFF